MRMVRFACAMISSCDDKSFYFVLKINPGLPLTNMHNTRSTNLRFFIPQAGVLHGFAGYFEAVLYKNTGISTHPERKDRISKDMLSWFPCYFPIKVRALSFPFYFQAFKLKYSSTSDGKSRRYPILSSETQIADLIGLASYCSCSRDFVGWW